MAVINWNEPDYTGAKAKEYIKNYTNRPEDAGTMAGLQGLLGMMGILAEPADWLNASIYAGRGVAKNAALYASGLGLMGGLKLFRGIPKWFKGTTVVNDKVVGGGAKHYLTGQKLPKENVYVTTSEKIADSFAGKEGIKIKFDVPEEYVKKHATSESSYSYAGHKKYSFSKGLPTKFIEKIYG